MALSHLGDIFRRAKMVYKPQEIFWFKGSENLMKIIYYLLGLCFIKMDKLNTED